MEILAVVALLIFAWPIGHVLNRLFERLEKGTTGELCARRMEYREPLRTK